MRILARISATSMKLDVPPKGVETFAPSSPSVRGRRQSGDESVRVLIWYAVCRCEEGGSAGLRCASRQRNPGLRGQGSAPGHSVCYWDTHVRGDSAIPVVPPLAGRRRCRQHSLCQVDYSPPPPGLKNAICIQFFIQYFFYFFLSIFFSVSVSVSISVLF
jgi:hypothetical protein